MLILIANLFYNHDGFHLPNLFFVYLFSRIFGMTKEHGLVLDTDDLTSIIRDSTSLCTVPPISEKHLLKKISLYALYKISFDNSEI